MTKFLLYFVRRTCFSQTNKHNVIDLAMSKRRNKPKFKPQVKSATNRQAAATMAPRKVEFEVLPTPTKSEADKKIYKTIRLDNGLTALLISDPSRPAVADDGTSDEESGSSDSSDSVSDESSPQHSIASDSAGTTRRDDFDEEKLCSNRRGKVVSFMKNTYNIITRKLCQILFNQLSLDTAACALSVNVGSYSDPLEIQGLAHFVEHMVFMGSKKYPKENDFDAFIKKKGGSDNASTDCEVTTFYFEITEKHLPHAMDMFSNFFVSPLMKKEAMQRERETIDSEFAIATPSDTNRKDQLLCSFFPGGHPARTFTWGNMKSLRDEINDDDKLYEKAHQFIKRHYSGNRMTVAVQARMDIPVLEQYVLDTFGHIPSNKLPAEDFSRYTFKPDDVSSEFRSMYYVKPVGDTTEVHITWCMRSLISEYESKPHQYVSYLLGHEGKGSLLSYLKKKVWALGIYTGNSESGIDYTSMYSLFSTQVVLTKEGLSRIDEVLEAVFSYLSMLRKIGPSARVYQEIKAIEETNFRFEEESQPASYVESLVENMHLFPPQHFITGEKLYFKFDPKGISDVLECMTADKANIMILSNKHATPIEYDSKEKWFGTEYKHKDIPENWLNRWLKVEPYPSFHLPNKNIYITTDFSLIPPAQPYLDVAADLGIDLDNSTMKDIRKKVDTAEKVNKTTLKYGDLMAVVDNFRLDQPNLLRKNDKLELWYKPDFKFRFPTALLYFYFITPLSLKSPRESCLLDLWTDVLNHGLKEETYPANLADLSHSIYANDKGVTVKINGYSQNLHLVVKVITEEMNKCTDDLTEKMFEAVREARSRVYYNMLIKPQKLAKDVRMNVLLEPYISPRDKAQLVNDITFEELMEFSTRVWEKFFIQALVQGNIPWHETIQIVENIVNNINGVAIPPKELPKFKVFQLPLGDHRARVMSFHKHSTNTIVANYYQAGFYNPLNTAILEVIMMLMEEPAFDTLRTKEQLGYSVYNTMRYTFGVLGFSITINTQCDKFSVSHVDYRVEVFLKKFASKMMKLSEKTLSEVKQSLVQLKHSTDYELEEEVERNFKEIVLGEYQFDRQFVEAETIECVQASDIKKWVDDHLASGNASKFRKLSVQVIGNQVLNNTTNPLEDDIRNYSLDFENFCNPDAENGKEFESDFIHDFDEFKRNLTVLNKKWPLDMKN